jgi:hypothetical protein
MIAPTDLRNKWQELASHGDYKKIADLHKIDYRKVKSCVTGEDVTLEVFEIVANYYHQVDNLINQYL